MTSALRASSSDFATTLRPSFLASGSTASALLVFATATSIPAFAKNEASVEPTILVPMTL
jgi:hypothetical protein